MMTNEQLMQDVEVTTKIYKTKNYNMFNSIKSNRKLNPLNYSKLMRSMSEEQLLIPICVNEKFEVIDGQHRLKAAQELGLEVYFYIVPNYGTDQMRRANLVSSTWGIDDYLNMFIEEEIEYYLTFNELKQTYGIGTNDLLKILAKIQGKAQQAVVVEFKEGFLDLNEEDKESLLYFLSVLEDFNFFSEYRRTKFIGAFLELFFYEEYRHEHMLARLNNSQGRKDCLTPNLSKDDLLETLANRIYSFGNSRQNIYYDKTRKSLYMIS